MNVNTLQCTYIIVYSNEHTVVFNVKNTVSSCIAAVLYIYVVFKTVILIA